MILIRIFVTLDWLSRNKKKEEATGNRGNRHSAIRWKRTINIQPISYCQYNPIHFNPVGLDGMSPNSTPKPALHRDNRDLGTPLPVVSLTSSTINFNVSAIKHTATQDNLDTHIFETHPEDNALREDTYDPEATDDRK